VWVEALRGDEERRGIIHGAMFSHLAEFVADLTLANQMSFMSSELACKKPFTTVPIYANISSLPDVALVCSPFTSLKRETDQGSGENSNQL
jgi:hypothetical protein